VTKRGCDTVEAVELSEQQTGKPALLALAKELLDEANACAASLSL
jgi:hypothetical protein